MLDNVHFGSADAPLPDWRKAAIDEPDDDDDEQLAATPPDVIEVLGFDPLAADDFDRDDDGESKAD